MRDFLANCTASTASTASTAQALGVRGHARNLADGSVEVLAGATPDAVEALLREIAIGPPMAKVTHTEVTELAPQVLEGIVGFACE